MYIVKETTSREGYKVYILDRHPEFWEEIIELDYEILSFKIPGNDHWEVVKLPNGTWNNWSDEHVRIQVEKGIWRIKSVKRLSDGEVFTIGDRINGYTYSSRIVLGFKICDVKGLMIRQSGGSTELVDASHCKIRKPIFTTKDGVEIFEDDYFWIVEEDLSFYRCRTPAHSSSSGQCSERTYLSSSDACHEYILMNKPSLSLNDLLSVWGEEGVENKALYASSPLFKAFEKVARSKS